MPIRRQPQKLSEVCHIVFKNSHYNSGIQHTVVTAKFDVSHWLLNKNRLLTNTRLNLLYIKHISGRILWLLRYYLLLIFFRIRFVTPLLLLYLNIILLLWVLRLHSARWRLLTLICRSICFLYLDFVEQLTLFLVFHLSLLILLSSTAFFGWYFTHVF